MQTHTTHAFLLIKTHTLVQCQCLMASSFSSSSSDMDQKIDALIAEATDLCALETITALNTAHLSETEAETDDSSSLPSNLESRFQKLKSFPPTPLPTATSSNLPKIRSLPQPTTNQEEEQSPPKFLNSPDSPIENDHHLKRARGRGRGGLGLGLGLGFSPLPSRSPSPTARASAACGCFGFSLRARRRAQMTAKRDHVAVVMKESRRKLKRAWEEQEKANKEVDKMVDWVKQVSIKINEASYYG